MGGQIRHDRPRTGLELSMNAHIASIAVIISSVILVASDFIGQAKV